MAPSDEFIEDLRYALNHLHDPDRLGRSRMASLFGVRGRHSTYDELQDILTGAILSMRPSSEVPPGARAWRMYELLHCRYVQEMSAAQVAHQLGLSVRHLHREQAAALAALGRQLWRRVPAGVKGRWADSSLVGPNGQDTLTSLREELLWLQEGSREGPADLGDVLRAVVDLAGPLARRHGAQIRYDVEAGVPKLAVHPVGLKQVLLSLITTASHAASGGVVQMVAVAEGWDVIVELRCPGSDAPTQTRTRGEDFDGAAELARLCGMRMWASAEGDPLAVRVAAPAYQGAVVLAVDDNEDTLRLLDRYLHGTRYRLVPETDPQRAQEAAESLRPAVVILDVMMPQVDGWRVLGRLRSHPATGHIPVVVCTILAEEELALTLGAAACLRKPVTQKSLLDALDLALAHEERESR